MPLWHQEKKLVKPISLFFLIHRKLVPSTTYLTPPRKEKKNKGKENKTLENGQLSWGLTYPTHQGKLCNII